MRGTCSWRRCAAGETAVTVSKRSRKAVVDQVAARAAAPCRSRPGRPELHWRTGDAPPRRWRRGPGRGRCPGWSRSGRRCPRPGSARSSPGWPCAAATAPGGPGAAASAAWCLPSARPSAAMSIRTTRSASSGGSSAGRAAIACSHLLVPLDVGGQQGVFLRREVVEEGARGDVGRLGDRFDGERVQTVGDGEAQGDPAQRLPGGGLLALAQPGGRLRCGSARMARQDGHRLVSGKGCADCNFSVGAISALCAGSLSAVIAGAFCPETRHGRPPGTSSGGRAART